MLLRSRFVLLCTLLVLLMLACHAADAPKTEVSTADTTAALLGGGPENVKLTPEEQRYVDLTNTERKAKNLTELVVAPLLVKVAREKSQEMHDLKYWGHESPVKDKRTAMYRVLYYLPKPPVLMTVGENLVLCPKVMTDEGHCALMASPTHKANIMNPVYHYIGIGAYTGEDGRFWVTEIFLDIVFGK